MFSTRSEAELELEEEMKSEILMAIIKNNGTLPALELKKELSKEEIESFSTDLKKAITEEKIPTEKHDKFIQYTIEGNNLMIRLVNSMLIDTSDEDCLEKIKDTMKKYKAEVKGLGDRFLSELGYSNDDDDVMKRISIRLIKSPAYLSILKYITHQMAFGSIEIQKAEERREMEIFLAAFTAAAPAWLTTEQESSVTEQSTARGDDIPSASALSQSMARGGILRSPSPESASPAAKEDAENVKRMSHK